MEVLLSRIRAYLAKMAGECIYINLSKVVPKDVITGLSADCLHMDIWTGQCWPPQDCVNLILSLVSRIVNFLGLNGKADGSI